MKNNNITSYKFYRERTPLKRIFAYKISEQYRFMKAKILRYLPENLSDKIIEKKYKKILGTKPNVIDPGSIEAAPGEKVNQLQN